MILGDYGSVYTFDILGIDLSLFKATESQTGLFIKYEDIEMVITSSFAIDVDTNQVSWTVPKSALSILQYVGTFECQLEFIDVTRSNTNITPPNRLNRTQVFNIVVKDKV